MKVVCRSRDTYIELCVEKYELVSAPGIVFAARCIACWIAALSVASPAVWKTTTLGGRTPTPNVFSALWLASYAGLPGIEKLWYQRLESLPAATPPISVSTIQAPITAQRCRAVKYANRPSGPGSAPSTFQRAGWTASILIPPLSVSCLPFDSGGGRNSSPLRMPTGCRPAGGASRNRGDGKPYFGPHAASS